MTDRWITVHGTRDDSRPDMFVLRERLEGYDTFLTGTLEVADQAVPVRIFTLDDVTVLRAATGSGPGGADWSGRLHLPHGTRPLRPPPDLTELACERRRDLTALDEAELRYALTFLTEATTPAIRRQRAAVIVDALPSVAAERSGDEREVCEAARQRRIPRPSRAGA